MGKQLVLIQPLNQGSFRGVGASLCCAPVLYRIRIPNSDSPGICGGELLKAHSATQQIL